MNIKDCLQAFAIVTTVMALFCALLACVAWSQPATLERRLAFKLVGELLMIGLFASTGFIAAMYLIEQIMRW